MKSLTLTILLILLTACSRAPETTIISLEQDFATAEAIARAKGYELRDVRSLAILPQPTGFYVEIPDDRILIIAGRDAGKVQWMSVVSNASQPKSFRTYTSVKTFDLMHDR